MILPFNTNVNNNFYTFNFLKLKPFSKWIVCRAKTRKEWEISEEDCEAPQETGLFQDELGSREHEKDSPVHDSTTRSGKTHYFGRQP
jgi:hypothetical protein